MAPGSGADTSLSFHAPSECDRRIGGGTYFPPDSGVVDLVRDPALFNMLQAARWALFLAPSPSLAGLLSSVRLPPREVGRLKASAESALKVTRSSRGRVSLR